MDKRFYLTLAKKLRAEADVQVKQADLLEEGEASMGHKEGAKNRRAAFHVLYGIANAVENAAKESGS